MPADLPLTPDLFATPHRFLWHPPTRTAILADLHLGLEDQLAQHGLYIPDLTSRWLQSAWSALLARRPAHLILAGDFFDSPNPSAQARAAAAQLLDQIPADCRITLTPGNHDPPAGNLDAFPAGRLVPLPLARLTPEIAILHGHDVTPLQNLSAPPPFLIVGHQHPSITFTSKLQSAKMVCFAAAPLPHTTLILLPAFSHAALGNNLRNPRHWLLPIPRPKDLDIFGIVCPAPPDSPRVLHFGPLSAF